MFGRKKEPEMRTYDRENKRPVLKCSICNGEQVAGFKDIHTGKFEEIMLIRNKSELNSFMEMYGIDTITKEY
ncbi:MAG: aspartate dehydrogenase [Lachnospiraceae bacterium]|nr:aspartate dehydrogenase [Lachnospiraceae bacterium]